MADSAGEEPSQQLTAGPATAAASAGIVATGGGTAGIHFTQILPSFGNALAQSTGDSAGTSPGLVASTAAASGHGFTPGSAVSGTTGDVSPAFGATIGVVGTAVGTAILAPSAGIGNAVASAIPSIGLGLTGTDTPNTATGLHPIAGSVAGAGLLSQLHSTFWDPTISTDWDNEKASQQCILRIKRDIMSIYKDPPPGMFVVPDPHDMTKVIGIGGGGVTLPSVLCRTWTGPAWSPAQSISSVLISIQSLMTENPYHNEPGFEQERHPGDSKNYNECIRHETMRVAVSDMLDGKCPCPEALWSVMEKSFLEYYDFYEGVCKERLHLQGQSMQDPFGEKRGHFDYQNLLSRLAAIQQRVKEKCQSQENDADTDSDSSSTGTDPDSQGSSKP
ncbi:ubiquitin-conjugating enzyme E2 Z-like [Polyodon spathula]|uniref:ubiquitin-conjugating enzyme E2 Z-like n=1 Tax=Polyodon spathula TaxID=7913 RepID=UPI001B7E4800|nr:ubiquitin-conjugating enzyme E2 Z-like [Polyodon spathula]